MKDNQNVSTERPIAISEVKRHALALKAARLQKGLNQKQAAVLCNCSRQSITQLENAMKGFSEQRLRSIVRQLGYQWSEYLTIFQEPNRIIRSSLETQTKRSRTSTPRRNTFKLITKEVRVLRILRTRKGISQCKASKLCGYTRCTFGQIEHGRIELPANRISKILNALEIPQVDFDNLMKADALKDEILANCYKSLALLDDEKLDSVQLIIKSFLKSKGVQL